MAPKSTEKPSRGKIAVVEETSDNIYSLRFILQSLGYEIFSVSDAEPLETQLQTFKPDVILVDMLMPDEGGLRAIRMLKEMPLENVIFLAITADVVEISEEELKKAGFDAVLKKPFSVAEMQKILNRE